MDCRYLNSVFQTALIKNSSLFAEDTDNMKHSTLLSYHDIWSHVGLLPWYPNAAGRNRCTQCWLQTGARAGRSK